MQCLNYTFLEQRILGLKKKLLQWGRRIYFLGSLLVQFDTTEDIVRVFHRGLRSPPANFLLGHGVCGENAHASKGGKEQAKIKPQELITKGLQHLKE